jgi:hypothetical protein
MTTLLYTQAEVGDVGVQNSLKSSNSLIEDDAWVLLDSTESSLLFSRRHGLFLMLPNMGRAYIYWSVRAPHVP